MQCKQNGVSETQSTQLIKQVRRCLSHSPPLEGSPLLRYLLMRQFLCKQLIYRERGLLRPPIHLQFELQFLTAVRTVNGGLWTVEKCSRQYGLQSRTAVRSVAWLSWSVFPVFC
ncbi:hypothetical protein J6590_064133, partial [Homalodisca vitripennis]